MRHSFILELDAVRKQGQFYDWCLGHFYLGGAVLCYLRGNTLHTLTSVRVGCKPVACVEQLEENPVPFPHIILLVVREKKGSL